MDRGEPSLVPEWLKGTSGAGISSSSSLSHHQHHLVSDNSDLSISARHRYSHSLSSREHESPRYFGSSERQSFHLARGFSNSIASGDRQSLDRDRLENSHAYASFRRSSSFRASYEYIDRDKNWERDSHLRDKSVREGRIHEWGSGREWQRNEDANLRRSRSAISNRNADDKDRKYANGIHSFTAPLMNNGLSSNIQKAAFDKNFPSLRGEEKQKKSDFCSNLINVTGGKTTSASISLGQGSFGKNESSRGTALASFLPSATHQSVPVSCISTVPVDGWKSALADAPVLNGSPSSPNGAVSVIQQITSGSLVSTKSSSVPAISGGLNMAEALILNQPKAKSQQPSVDSHRMEELALKQSKQLIPRTASKVMGLSLSEKSKLKPSRSIETASAIKGQSPISSALGNSNKVSQSGKLLVLKPSRETGYAYSSKSNGTTNIKTGFGENNLHNAASGIDKKVVNLTTADVPQTSPATDANNSFEEKKSVTQAQNRSDFFRELRRKASGNQRPSASQEFLAVSTSGQTERSDTNTETNMKVLLDSKVESSGDGCPVRSAVNDADAETKEKNNNKSLNGFILEKVKLRIKADDESDYIDSGSRNSIKVASEEEEAAFLRSLGWEEKDEVEEITEEEIQSFYKEIGRKAAADVFQRGNPRLWNLCLGLTDRNNVESLSSGIGSSESA